MLPGEIVLMLMDRHVTHTRSYLYRARTRPRKSLFVHVAPRLFKIYRIILVQIVSHPSQPAVNDVQKNDRVGIPVRGHATRDRVLRVMKRWSGLVDVVKVSWLLDVTN